MKDGKNILIVGAGLCGSYLALRMAQKGYKIQLIEKRPDLRTTTLPAGRSINLALSNRGLKAMKMAGIEDQVRELLIPMHGRMIHEANNNNFLSPYSGLEDEFINSVPRTGLNALLLEEAEKIDGVEIHFNMECISADIENASATFKNTKSGEEIEKSGDVLIGTDGAGSVIRKSFIDKNGFLFNFSQQFLSHGYKELYIPPGENNSYLMEKNALHIWPRGENMIIALPNLDGSFTVTLFLAHKGEKDNFEKLQTHDAMKAYFDQNYPDAVKLMPNLDEIFFKNPTNSLGTIKCSPWNYKGKSLIMGDAAHAMVPFYGQGMNASFEDVVVFDQVLNEGLNSWEEIFSTFSTRRKPDADAICDLSLDNFEEMKADTASPLFQQKRKIETAIEKKYPEKYSAKYRLVTFQENIGYHEAMTRGRAQDKAFLKLIKEKEITENTPLEESLEKVLKTTEEILQSTTEL